MKMSESMGMDVLIVDAALRHSDWLTERIKHLANSREVTKNISGIYDDRNRKCKKFEWDGDNFKLEIYLGKVRE